jgi:diacylglycerol kinase (ATP)
VAHGTVLIVNPAAGNGRCARTWPSWARRLAAAGVAHSTVFTTRPGDATRLTREALLDGAETVVAVGGDGTANEVVNGFFDGDEAINPSARFGILPAGTGVDLSRMLGLRGPMAIAALGPSGQTGAIDLGRVRFVAYGGQVRSRYFVNGGDLGVGGETAALAQKGSKAFGGFVAYLTAAIRAIVEHQPRLVRYSIDDGPTIEARVDTIFVTNGRYIGGGMIVAPPARVDDGALDVLVLRAVSKLDLLFRLLPAIYRGTHLRHPSVQHVQARRVSVQTSEPLLLQIDGEQPGMAPAEFVVLPGILRVALPPSFPRPPGPGSSGPA